MIGGSFARALKKHSLASTVIGCGRSRDNLVFALEKGYVDEITQDPAEAAKGADLVVLASPVETFEEIVRSIKDYLETGTLVIDTGSVKGKLVACLQALMPEGVQFVGCHPIAGSEKAGAVASVEGLYEGALCLITPSDSNTDEVVSKAKALWEAVGSDVQIMDPIEHDELLGLVSHFPHLAAYAMINTIEDSKDGAVALSGAGLKDTTRIAMSPAILWRDISMMNRDNIVPVLDAYIKELEALRDELAGDNATALEERLKRAELRRRRVEG